MDSIQYVIGFNTVLAQFQQALRKFSEAVEDKRGLKKAYVMVRPCPYPSNFHSKLCVMVCPCPY